MGLLNLDIKSTEIKKDENYDKGQKFKTKALNNQRADNDKRNQTINNKVSSLTFGGIFKFVIFLLLLSLVVRTLLGYEPLTFVGFLENVVNTKTSIDLEFINNILALEITGDWGIFNFFKDFLNLNLGVLQGGFCVSALIFNGIVYIFSFISWIFFV